MFAHKEIKKQNKATAFSTQKRHENGAPGGPIEAGNLPGSTRFLQWNLGNSYLQSALANKSIQRKCSCGGSCGKEDEDKRIQAKLKIGPANDVYEQEADRVAEQVMRMPGSPLSSESEQSYPGIHIQRISAGECAGFDADLNLNQSGGRSLSPSTRQFIEPRFGADFGHVRLHTDEQAHQTTSQIQARAFTYGHHIWLGEGANEGDKRLMAHELTHVVQQGAAVSKKDKSETTGNTNGHPKIQRDEKDRCPNGTKTVTVDLVSLNGSNRDAPDDLDFANSIFRSCCVQFQLGTGVSVQATDSDTWLGGDTDLQREHSCTNVHAEEEAMRAGATATFGLSSDIRVFYVQDMTPSERAVSFPPFCASGDRARFVNHSYVTNTGARRTLAHEIGHILLNADTHTTHPGGTENLMEPTNSATGETLEASQCATIFSNA